MKSTFLASSTALFLAVAACANSAPTVSTGQGGAPGSGGSTGTGGASSTGSGGVSSSGGSTGTGGTSSTGTGGASSGGSTGTAGASSGGSTGTGGASSGGSTGTGGASSGGSTGTGGASSGGSSGAGGGTSLLSVVGSLDGVLIKYPCGSNTNDGFDCPNVGCSGSPSTVTHTSTFQIAGTAGTTYNMTFNVRGVMEVYAYNDGTGDADRDAKSASITTNGDLFERGGTLLARGATGYDYNTYEMDVAPSGGGTPDVYYLNSVATAENPNAAGGGSPALHTSFAVSYGNKTIKVYGGGTITIKTYDANCVQIMNCGTKSQNANDTCSSHNIVDLSDVVPQTNISMTAFPQPWSTGSKQFGQWLVIDVTAVTVAQ